MSILGIAMTSDGDELELHVTPAYLRYLADELETNKHLEIEGIAVDLDEPVTVSISLPDTADAGVDADQEAVAHEPSAPEPNLPIGGATDIAVRIDGDFILAVDVSGGTNSSRMTGWMRSAASAHNCRQVITFDLQAREHDPKDELTAHGGTDFRPVQEYVESYPDDIQVLVLTDGYGPRITPAHPERWTWAIIGQLVDFWPHQAGMKTYRTK